MNSVASSTVTNMEAFKEAINQPLKEDDQSFRVKKAVKVAFIAIAVSLTAVASLALFSVTVLPCVATIVLATITGVALAILLSGKLIWMNKERFPASVQKVINRIHGLISEIAGAVVLGAVFPLDLRGKSTKKEDYDPNKPTVLFVNGYLGSSNNFIYLYHRLKKQNDCNFLFVNVGNPLKKQETHVEHIKEKMAEFQKDVADGEKPTWLPVCHSMGGLLAKGVWSDSENEDTIPFVATFCTPHNGTKSAHIPSYVPGFRGGCGAEMTPVHERVSGLLDKEKAKGDQAPIQLLFHSQDDWVVDSESAQNSVHQDSPKILREELPKGIGHIWCLFDEDAATKVVNAVKFFKEGMSVV